MVLFGYFVFLWGACAQQITVSPYSQHGCVGYFAPYAVNVNTCYNINIPAYAVQIHPYSQSEMVCEFYKNSGCTSDSWSSFRVYGNVNSNYGYCADPGNNNVGSQAFFSFFCWYDGFPPGGLKRSVNNSTILQSGPIPKTFSDGEIVSSQLLDDGRWLNLTTVNNKFIEDKRNHVLSKPPSNIRNMTSLAGSSSKIKRQWYPYKQYTDYTQTSPAYQTTATSVSAYQPPLSGTIGGFGPNLATYGGIAVFNVFQDQIIGSGQTTYAMSGQQAISYVLSTVGSNSLLIGYSASVNMDWRNVPMVLGNIATDGIITATSAGNGWGAVATYVTGDAFAFTLLTASVY